MDTARRVEIYATQSRITPRMRRRLIKKAGRDPYATVVRDDGMGFAPGRQGLRELMGFSRPVPVSGAGVGTGRGHEAVDAWIDEQAF